MLNKQKKKAYRRLEKAMRNRRHRDAVRAKQDQARVSVGIQAGEDNNYAVYDEQNYDVYDNQDYDVYDEQDYAVYDST